MLLGTLGSAGGKAGRLGVKWVGLLLKIYVRQGISSSCS